ncbi:MAG: DUF4124 domain-containing protein [Proteobacteria bacterium]|nr:DUF4124 domain-containing protein [Pseudomonadota bacterium]
MKKAILITLSLCLTTATFAGKIYKYTATDGSIHYTDVKPNENSQEVKADKITIIEAVKIKAEPRKVQEPLDKKQENTAFRYDDLAIVKPESDESLWGTGGNVTVSVNLDKEIPTKYRIKFFLDGKPRGHVKSNTQLIADVERGEHFVYAQLINAQNRKVLKTTDKVRFFVHQQSKK